MLNPKYMTEQFAFRVNDYYFNLINWNDPKDPIKRLAIPDDGEHIGEDREETSTGKASFAVPGCRHVNPSTVLLTVSEGCGAYCRYCYRKRYFRQNAIAAVPDLEPALDYISKHTEINHVWLTGGDSLLLPTSVLRPILLRLQGFNHVVSIRLGSKIPVLNPMRIYEDSELLDTLRELSDSDKRVYAMAHIHHPREVTPEAKKGFQALHDAGALVLNQTPILRGINDDPAVLGELIDRLSWAGVTPYEVYVIRPAPENRDFIIPLQQVYRILEEAKAKTPGIGKHFRLVMRHQTGKIEIMAIENRKAYLKYHHSSSDPYGRLVILDCPEDAVWFDNLPDGETNMKPPENKANSSGNKRTNRPPNGYVIMD